MQDMSHDLIYLHHTMITLDRANIVRILLHIRLFRHQFTIQIKIFRSHKYFAGSAGAQVVKGLSNG